MISDWYDKEEERLVNAVNAGDISQEEFHLAVRELSREYMMEAEEAAQSAYDMEMERW